jgi:hypothetical protein
VSLLVDTNIETACWLVRRDGALLLMKCRTRMVGAAVDGVAIGPAPAFRRRGPGKHRAGDRSSAGSARGNFPPPAVRVSGLPATCDRAPTSRCGGRWRESRCDGCGGSLPARYAARIGRGMTEDARRQIEESRGLLEQTRLSIEWLRGDVARSKRLIAESRRLLEIADFAIARTIIPSPITHMR